MKYILFISCFLLSGCMIDYNMGLTKIKEGKFQEATELLTKAHTQYPKNPQILFSRGISRGFQENYTGAVADLTRAIKLEKSADYYFYRAYFKSKLGNEKGAIADYSKSIEIYPYYSESYFNRGVKLLSTGNLTEACYDFQYATDLGDTLSLGYLNIYCRSLKRPE
jgi:tetratricopeptide (TPR) repeat protein